MKGKLLEKITLGGEFEHVFFRVVVFGIIGGPGSIRPFVESLQLLKVETFPSSEVLLSMPTCANAARVAAQGTVAEFICGCTSGISSKDEDEDENDVEQDVWH